jgi:hypothetical protein
MCVYVGLDGDIRCKMYAERVCMYMCGRRWDDLEGVVVGVGVVDMMPCRWGE